MAFIALQEPASGNNASHRFALWELGFRPFYLFAAIFAAASVFLWVAQVRGWLPRPYLAGGIWHAHEMVFGFTLAVIVGFLFTAGRNWTGQPTPTGPALQALVFLWVAGRVAVLTPYAVPAAVICVAFPFAAAVALAIPLRRARNRRNYFFPALLLLAGLAQAAVHLSELGILSAVGWPAIQVGLDIVLVIMSVMAGRVVPMFTNNGAPGANARREKAIEMAANGSAVTLLALDLANAPQTAAAMWIIAGLHLARWLLWQPWKTLRAPLVWILHGAYLWIPVHLILRGAALAGWAPQNLAAHALTVGAIGCLTIGMMCRTARGHTGRLLQASRWETAAFLCIFCSAVVRVFGGLIFPAFYLATVEGSAFLWTAGFLIYAWRFWPVLMRARVDGLPG